MRLAKSHDFTAVPAFFLGQLRYVPWDFYDDPEVAQIAEEEPVGIVWG